MDEFFRIWVKVKRVYGLERTVRKSLDQFEMRIYRDRKLIIKEIDETEELMYYNALLALLRYVRSHDC